jgi:hypothetical protein
MSEYELLKQQEQKTKKKGAHTIEFHLDDDLRQVFVGHHTLFSVLGFTVGGILIGGTLEKMLHEMVGQPMTLVIGLVLLLISGLVLKQFNG